MSPSDPAPVRESFRLPFWVGMLAFLAIAVFFLWEEHKAHIMGALPWLLLALCPLLHVFMHRGHHQSDGHGRTSDGRPSTDDTDAGRGGAS